MPLTFDDLDPAVTPVAPPAPAPAVSFDDLDPAIAPPTPRPALARLNAFLADPQAEEIRQNYGEEALYASPIYKALEQNANDEHARIQYPNGRPIPPGVATSNNYGLVDRSLDTARGYALAVPRGILNAGADIGVGGVGLAHAVGYADDQTLQRAMQAQHEIASRGEMYTDAAPGAGAIAHGTEFAANLAPALVPGVGTGLLAGQMAGQGYANALAASGDRKTAYLAGGLSGALGAIAPGAGKLVAPEAAFLGRGAASSAPESIAPAVGNRVAAGAQNAAVGLGFDVAQPAITALSDKEQARKEYDNIGSGALTLGALGLLGGHNALAPADDNGRPPPPSGAFTTNESSVDPAPGAVGKDITARPPPPPPPPPPASGKPPVVGDMPVPAESTRAKEPAGEFQRGMQVTIAATGVPAEVVTAPKGGKVQIKFEDGAKGWFAPADLSPFAKVPETQNSGNLATVRDSRIANDVVENPVENTAKSRITAVPGVRLNNAESLRLRAESERAARPVDQQAATERIIKPTEPANVAEPVRQIPEEAGGQEGQAGVPGQKEKEIPAEENAGSAADAGSEPVRSTVRNVEADQSPGRPDKGEAFAQELMEATRRLGATARYKHIRHPGQFIKDDTGDKIEMRDVRTTFTAAHELGHAIDYALNPTSMKTLAARVGGNERVLRNELWDVSTSVRPLPDKPSANHMAYRRSSKELVADFVASYLHDRDGTRAKAPEFSRGFEQALEKNAAIKDAITSLTESGTVRPKITAAESGGEIEHPVEPPGVPPKRETLGGSSDEPEAADAATDLLKQAVRTRRMEVASSNQDAIGWQKRLKSDQLEDVGAAMEGIGNVRRKGDTVEAVQKRMTPEMEKVLKEVRFKQEVARQEVNKYMRGANEAEYIKYLEDYLPHFYVNAKKIFADGSVAKWAKNSPNAKQRKLPTLKDATDMGLIPVTQNAAILHKMWSEINWRVATNRVFVSKLKDIATRDGEPVIQPASKAPADWVRIDHPAIQQVYAIPAGDKGVLLWRGGAAVHPDIAPAVRNMLDEVFNNKWVKGIELANSFAKTAQLSLSLFHHQALTFAAQGRLARVTNPLRGFLTFGEGGKLLSQPHRLGLRLLEDKTFLRDWYGHGGTAGESSDLARGPVNEFLQKIAADPTQIPGFGKLISLTRTAPIMRPLFRRLFEAKQWWDYGLWDRYHTGLKAFAYHDTVQNILKSGFSGDIDAMKEKVASHINDAFGGQEWETQLWLSPKMKQAAHMTLLSPDWTLSTLKLFGKTFTTDPTQLKLNATFWRNMIFSLGSATVGLQYGIYKAFGDDKKGDKAFPWENETGQKTRIDVTPLWRALGITKDGDKTRHYTNVGKQEREIINWFSDPVKELTAKSSPVVREALVQASGITGHEGSTWYKAPFAEKGFWEGLPARAKQIASEFLPLSVKGSQFAMTLPVRKGMTHGKAVALLTDSFEAYAEPSLLGKLNQPSYVKSLPDLAADVIDAAKRNGHDEKTIVREAQAAARTKVYGNFFKAWESKDAKALDDAAQAVVRLHANEENIADSAKIRGVHLSAHDESVIRHSLNETSKNLTHPAKP